MAVIPPHAWEWRIFDPVSGSNRVFHRLHGFPIALRWDSSFAYVEFILGDKIARAPWSFTGEVEEMAQLPSDSSLCDFWRDSAGSWHVVTQREIKEALPDGRASATQIGVRWDLPAGASKWRVAEVDSAAGGHYGECHVTAKLERDAPRPRVVTAAALLEAMCLDPNKASVVSQDRHGSQNATDWVWVASESDTTLGFEMGAGEGDTYHAFEPMMWTDRKHNRRRTVYSLGRSKDQSLGQIAFMESQGMVLIVSEYEGGHPCVVDVRTGKVSLSVDRPSARAIWVPAPQ
jgi:hypothetical protein